MINKTAKISRSSPYSPPVGFSAEMLELMRQIDRVFTQYPFSAAARLRPICRGLGAMPVATGCAG